MRSSHVGLRRRLLTVIVLLLFGVCSEVVAARPVKAVESNSENGSMSVASCTSAASVASTSSTVPTTLPTDPQAVLCSTGQVGISTGPWSARANQPSLTEVPTNPLVIPLRASRPETSNVPNGRLAVTIAGVAAPRDDATPSQGFQVGEITSALTPKDWMEVGWINGSHCGPKPTVFTEYAIAGKWYDACWANEFPLTAGARYYFALTRSPGAWTSWVYWNSAWFSLITLVNPALASTSGVPNCADNLCVDAMGIGPDVGSAAFLVCGFFVEACGPLALIGGGALAAYSIGQDIFGSSGTYTCGSPFTDQPYIDEGSGYINYAGGASCNATVYALTLDVFGLRNDSSYASTGTSCNYCYYLEGSLSVPTNFGLSSNYYADYQTEAELWEDDTSPTLTANQRAYSSAICPCGV